MERLASAIGRFVIGVGMVCIVCAVAGAYETRAQDSMWSLPVLFSSPAVSASYPRLAADPSGRVHGIWSEKVEDDIHDPDPNAATPGRVIYYTLWDPFSDIWNEPSSILVSPDHGPTHRPALLYDGRGKLHVSWTLETIYYAWAPADPPPISARAWSAPLAMSDSLWGDRVSEWTTDQGGTLHLVWESVHPDVGSEIKYVRSLDQGKEWTSAKTISLPGEHPWLPRIYADSRGTIFVTWWSDDRAGVVFGGGDGSYNVARSTDGGESFQVQTLGQGYLYLAAISPIALAEADGRLVLAWTDRSRLYAATSFDGGEQWTEGQEVKYNQNTAQTVDLIADSAGDVHAFTVSRVTGGARINHLVLTRNGEHLEDHLPMIPHMTPGEMSEVRAVISQGNRLHVVASLYNEQSLPRSRLEVWYSYRLLNTPVLPPSPVPTVDVGRPATPRPTSSQVPSSTHAPVLTRTMAAGHTWEGEAPTGPTRNEPIFAVGLPILIVGGFLMVVSIIRIRRRH